jgi:hypothetical protein
MFASEVGETAVSIVGNEQRTLGILEAIGTDVLLEMLELQGFFGSRGTLSLNPKKMEDSGFRAVVIPANPSAPAALVLLEPNRSVENTQSLTDTQHLRLRFDLIEKIADDRFRAETAITGDFDRVQDFVFSNGLRGLAETLWITQPDVVISRRPKMVPLSAPWPCLKAASGVNISTGGILCRDANGRLGITACYHGTGPVGTAVTVGGLHSVVAIADNIQDMVFVPLGDNLPIPPLRGRRGVLSARAPGQYDHVEFHGASSGAMQTRIASYDAGILRLRPTVQLRVQTGADTNTGDSGSALLDQDDKVVGFAFERTAFGEFPEMTDWIWAANALKTLGLTPV